MRRTTLIALTTLTLALTGCTAASEPTPPSNSSAPAVSESPVAPAVAEPDGSRENPFSFGTVTRVSEDSIWDFTIHGPQADANAWVLAADEWNEAPASGNTWVGANIAVTVRDVPALADIQSEPTSPYWSLDVVYVGSSGTVYDFWTVGMPAVFNGTSWNSLPDAFMSAGMSWDQPFAIEVPEGEVDGGMFAVNHTTSGRYIAFAG